MNARVKITGQTEGPEFKFPVLGKIRPGIKILTPKAKAIPEVVEMYRKGLEAGASNDDIEKACKTIEGCPARPLMPRNSPYFRVHPVDFSEPGVADRIMSLYGTKRPGDTTEHLYSFPVVFPTSNIDLVFVERFESWKASTLYRWSDGVGRNCLKKEELKPDRSKRRRWGGRQTIVDRECNPNDCDLFAEGKCDHSSYLHFWIPGVTGLGVIQLQFKSIYASARIMDTLQAAQATLRQLAQLGMAPAGTDINSMINGKPIFTLSKSVDNISRINRETGQPTRQRQYIIQLDATGLDMTALLAAGGENWLKQKRLKSPETEQLALEAEEPEPEVVADAGETTDTSTGEIEPEQVEPEQVEPDPSETYFGDFEPEPEPEPAPEPEKPASGAKADPEVTKRRGQLSAIYKRLGWSHDDFKEWVVGNGVAEADLHAATHDVRNLDSWIAKLATLDTPATTEEYNSEVPY